MFSGLYKFRYGEARILLMTYVYRTLSLIKRVASASNVREVQDRQEWLLEYNVHRLLGKRRRLCDRLLLSPILQVSLLY